MILKRAPFLVALFFAGTIAAQSSQSASGPSGGKCLNCVQPLDGSQQLGFTYQKDTCGLSYVVVSQKLGQRFAPPGPAQPVTITINGLPNCTAIEKAFLWCDASGTGIPITATISNPAGNTANYPMTMIGSGPDKCWAYAGTYSYRADVTSAISGNGNYIFSGFPTGATDDVDGMTMMIIFRDPNVTWEGHIIIYDGEMEVTAGATTQSITNLAPCGPSTSAHAFMIVADLQNVGTTMSMNNGPGFNILEDWWNYIDQPTTAISTSQTQSDFNVTSSGDCYNFMMMGLYYQTVSCQVCTAHSFLALNVNTTSTGGCGATTGSVSATASGGQAPYHFTWSTGDTTQTVNNLPAGTYIVNVTDASGCGIGSDTVVVNVGNFPNAQFSLSPSPAFYPGQICVTDQTAGATNWQWFVDSIPSDTSASFCYTLPDTGNYCFGLIVANAAGCPDTTTQCVDVLGQSIISVPNVFTPGGDGVNDVFEVTWLGLTKLHCEIYDRWGVKVYEWDGLDGSWNGTTSSGKKATDGVYYYVVNATTIKNEQKTLTGFVHLIRQK